MCLRYQCIPDRKLVVMVKSKITADMYNDLSPDIFVESSLRNSYMHHKKTSWSIFYSKNGKTVTCIISAPKNCDTLRIQLKRLSLVIARDAETRSGLLVHGALAERDGWGVILAGPGGVGKTTASKRLRQPWRSLCDDTTLVVRDEQGLYWAHPWPTWSNFKSGVQGEKYDVQHAVPLKGFFFLVQSKNDEATPIRNAQAVCLLTKCVEQASRPLFHLVEHKEARKIRLKRFNNICLMSHTVPTFLLQSSRDGAFWEEVERSIYPCRKSL